MHDKSGKKRIFGTIIFSLLLIVSAISLSGSGRVEIARRSEPPNRYDNLFCWIQEKETGNGTINLPVSETTVIQLWMAVPNDMILIGLSTILDGYDADGSKEINWYVEGFHDIIIPDSLFQRITRGPIEDDLPVGDGRIDEYCYVGEDQDYPFDGDSGIVGPRTVLLDEIIIQGAIPNIGPDRVYFGNSSYHGYEVKFIPDPPPGGWFIFPVTIDLGIGSYDNPILINIIPSIVAARSYSSHTVAGELHLELYNYFDSYKNSIEPRLLPDYIFEFDLSVPVSNVTVTDASVTFIDNDTIRVTMDNPIPDQWWYTISITGDVMDSYTVGFLAGDINRDCVVSTSDASIIKPHFGEIPSPDDDNIIFDFNCDGIISTSDYSQIKPQFGNSLT